MECSRDVSLSEMPKGRPYKKKSSKGRRTYKKYYKPKYNKKSLFKESSSNQVELKNRDIFNTAGILPIAPAWTIPTLCNQVTQGVDANQRLGRRYTITSFGYRGTMQSVSLCPTRILVVWDKSPNGVTPLINDILSTDNFNSMMQLTNADRFTIVSDKIYTNSVDGSSTGAVGSLIVKEYKKMALETVCLGTGATVADITTGALWIMACQSNGAAQGSFQIFTRLRYRDA